jgi:hypothetical protein
MFESDEREADLRSTRALVDLLRDRMRPGESVELYAVWEGNEGRQPRDRVVWSLEQIVPETVLFTEDFLYEVRAGAV